MSGHGQSSGNYGQGPELQCCEPVADLTSLLGAIGAIAGLSLFLRQAVIDNMIAGGKKRSIHMFNFWSQGKPLANFVHLLDILVVSLFKNFFQFNSDLDILPLLKVLKPFLLYLLSNY